MSQFNYNWDISKWVTMVLAASLRKRKRQGILIALIGNVKHASGNASSLYAQFTEFMAYCRLRTRYNGQQGSLQALLNKLFDPNLNRIYLVTTSDTINTVYGKKAGENRPTVYGKKAGENRPTVYGRKHGAYTGYYHGLVYVPAALNSRELEIKKWIDFNIYLGKRYRIIYT